MKQKIFEVGKKAYTFNQARYEEDMGRCVITAVSERYITDDIASKNNDKAPLWKLKEEHRTKATHELVGKTYTTNKRLISFRAGIVEREMTEEQRRETAERLRKWRENNKTEETEETEID